MKWGKFKTDEQKRTHNYQLICSSTSMLAQEGILTDNEIPHKEVDTCGFTNSRNWQKCSQPYTATHQWGLLALTLQPALVASSSPGSLPVPYLFLLNSSARAQDVGVGCMPCTYGLGTGRDMKSHNTGYGMAAQAAGFCLLETSILGSPIHLAIVLTWLTSRLSFPLLVMVTLGGGLGLCVTPGAQLGNSDGIGFWCSSPSHQLPLLWRSPIYSSFLLGWC